MLLVCTDVYKSIQAPPRRELRPRARGQVEVMKEVKTTT